MRHGLKRGLWIAGTPARLGLVAFIRLYQVTLGGLMGGRCRFYPTCSRYAEQAIRECGAVRGLALTVWRVLRCSPLSGGGVDYPPGGRPEALNGSAYDTDIPVLDRRIHGARQGAHA
jgi:uncharacterized protein